MEAKFNKALHLLDADCTEKSIDLLNEIITEASDTHNTLYYIRANCVMGDVLFDLEKYDEAKQHLMEVVNTPTDDDLDDLVDYEKERASELLEQLP